MVRMVRGTLKSWNQRDKIELRRKWKHGDKWWNCKNDKIESGVLPDFRENDEIKRENIFLQRHNPMLLRHERWKQGDEIQIEIRETKIKSKAIEMKMKMKMKLKAIDSKMKMKEKDEKDRVRGTKFTLSDEMRLFILHKPSSQRHLLLEWKSFVRLAKLKF